MDNSFKTHVYSLGIVAAAVDKGQPKDGVQKGQKEIREHGLEELLEKLGKLSASLNFDFRPIFHNFTVAHLLARPEVLLTQLGQYSHRSDHL
ncbi:Arginase-1 [Taenia solium]|eukprot:TsM_001226200 transcript=TsM_001226200 gene=TsM_001226200